MPTLSACNSVFQLAAGLNLVASVIISDFDRAKQQIAEVFLGKVQEFVPAFNVVERVRSGTIDFIFRFVPALRFARSFTYLLALWSIAMTGVSFFALYAAAIEPDRRISVETFNWFFWLMLVASPCLYLSQGLFWRQILSLITDRAVPTKEKGHEFADSIQRHIEVREQLREADQVLEHAKKQMVELAWRSRRESIASACQRFLRRFRR